MTSRRRTTLAVATLAAQTAIVIGTAPAARAIDTSGFSSSIHTMSVQVAAGARTTVRVSCPAGTTPIAGGIQTPPAGDGVIHDRDYVNWGDGASFEARVRNWSADAVQVTAYVRCVTWGRLTAKSRVVATFAENNVVHLAGGVASCPAGSYALSARVDWSDVADTPTIDYSGPTWDLLGWRVSGTYGGTGNHMTVDVQCVKSAGLPGAYLVHVQQGNQGSTSIYPTLAATCPAGMVPVNGGSFAEGGDPGVSAWYGTAYSSYPTATGWVTQGVVPVGATMYATTWCIPNQEPALTLSGPQPIYSNSATAQFQFSASDSASAGGYTLKFQCALDGGPLAACASPWATSVPEGRHTATVKVTTSDSRSALTTYDWFYDKTAPTAKTTARTAPFSLADHVLVRWAGLDGEGTGVRSYNVRYRTATYKKPGFGAYQYPATLQGVGTTSTQLGSAPGVTSCYSAQAVDRAANKSPYSVPRCTARPIDDRALSASHGWAARSDDTSWNGTYRGTTTHNATLTLARASLDRVGIVATTGASCGKVAILVAGTQIGTISLAASTTHHRVILALPPFSTRTGTVVIKVVSTGKQVDIDGLAISHA